LLSFVQLPVGLADVKMALLINVFSVAHIIHHEASAFQFKKGAVIPGAQAILVLEAFQLFDVARREVVPVPSQGIQFDSAFARHGL